MDNNHDRHLCARTLLSSSIASIISKPTNILCIIGTSSIRATKALDVIQQTRDVIDTVRLHDIHLPHKHAITVMEIFPCFKVSANFPSTTSLSNNITMYNKELQLLEEQMNFSCINFNITSEHLHHDHMHLKHQYQNFLYNAIIDYFDTLIDKKLTISQNQRRSRTAITKRNKK